MKRTIISAAVLALAVGGTGISLADPGPNGNNDGGLCRAYFAGSENGQENKRKAGPFAALEDAASDDDDATSPEEDVAAFCVGLFPGNSEGKGNPEPGSKGGGKAEDPA